MPTKFNELLLRPDIEELYQNGVTPDYGYLLNGRFEKDMIRTLLPLPTITGNPITWCATETELLYPTITLSPKQAGKGDPSPDNVRPISGRDSVQVTRCGKNLIPYGTQTFTEHYFSSFGKFIPAGTYTFSAKVTSDDATYTTCLVQFFNSIENKRVITKQIDRNIRVGVTVDVPAPFDAVYLYASIGFNESKGVTATYENTQLELGSTPTPYEPYQPGTTATLTLPETIYGGTVDAVTGVGSKEWVTVILTGDEVWTTWGVSRPNSFFVDVKGHKNLANNASNVLCNSFVFDNGDNRYAPYHFFTQNPGAFPDNVRICLSFDETVTSVDLAKQWIAVKYAAGTPVTICYKLAAPEPFQATGNQSLTIGPGNHTIYTDGDTITLKRKVRRLNV